MPEKLEIHIDGSTYTVPRRRMRGGRTGFLLQSGAVVHGRRCWIQVLVAEVPPLSDADKMRRIVRNRQRRVAARRKRAAQAEAARAEAAAWRMRNGQKDR